jgi:hypothetical protein
MSYTKGPWKVWPYSGADKWIEIDGPAVQVDYDDVNHKEQAANARLIAAAPELLEACEVALESLRAWNSIGLPHEHQKAAREAYETSPEIQRLLKAIAKATGAA